MKYTALIFSILFVINVQAQKLPDVQQLSLIAPANIKIDGKLNEWGGLKAYNKATEIYYTISNNSEYLYLAVKVTNTEIINKLLMGGLAFTLNTDGNKKERNGIMLTYPAFQKGSKGNFFPVYKKQEIWRDHYNKAERLDSLVKVCNAQLKKELKFLNISGINNATNELTSIYNEAGVLVMSEFDNDLFYNFELAIPLQLLEGATKLSYNIQLNGHAFGGTDVRVIRDKFLVFVGSDGLNYTMGDATPRNWGLVTPSSFWGEYILAK